MLQALRLHTPENTEAHRSHGKGFISYRSQAILSSPPQDSAEKEKKVRKSADSKSLSNTNSFLGLILPTRHTLQVQQEDAEYSRSKVTNSVVCNLNSILLRNSCKSVYNRNKMPQLFSNSCYLIFCEQIVFTRAPYLQVHEHIGLTIHFVCKTQECLRNRTPYIINKSRKTSGK